MGVDQLSTAVTMLCDRMELHPEEFINAEWDPIKINAWDDEPFDKVRWGNFIRVVMTTGKELIFSDEEIEHIRDCYKKLLRKQFEECILKELVGGEWQKNIEFQQKQLNLPYIPPPTKRLRMSKGTK